MSIAPLLRSTVARMSCSRPYFCFAARWIACSIEVKTSSRSIRRSRATASATCSSGRAVAVVCICQSHSLVLGVFIELNRLVVLVDLHRWPGQSAVRGHRRGKGVFLCGVEQCVCHRQFCFRQIRDGNRSGVSSPVFSRTSSNRTGCWRSSTSTPARVPEKRRWPPISNFASIFTLCH